MREDNADVYKTMKVFASCGEWRTYRYKDGSGKLEDWQYIDSLPETPEKSVKSGAGDGRESISPRAGKRKEDVYACQGKA